MQSRRNSKIYVGYTSKEPDIRIQEHNSGTNKWSKRNEPFTLKYYEEYICKKDAIKREKFYKSGFGRRIKDCIIETLGG